MKSKYNMSVQDNIFFAKFDFSLVDLASMSCQKFFGMKGIGALIKRENLVIEPIIHGGKSTTIYRSGTPATPLIVSFAKALRLTYDNFKEKENHVKEIHDYLISKLQNLDVYINSNNYSINNIVNFSLKNIKSEVMLHALEEKEIYEFYKINGNIKQTAKKFNSSWETISSLLKKMN